MTRILVNGCSPYDGHYELDLDQELTTREWGWIKRLAGYLPLALTDDAFGDPELVCVFAAIAMRRTGRIGPSEVPGIYERLIDTPFGTAITFDPDEQQDEADDAGPPPGSSSSSADTSGTASPASSVTPAPRRSRTGTRGSGTSASVPATSVS